MRSRARIPRYIVRDGVIRPRRVMDAIEIEARDRMRIEDAAAWRKVKIWLFAVALVVLAIGGAWAVVKVGIG